MYNELKNKKIIIDIEMPISANDQLDDLITSYAEFMKERMMNLSGNN